MSLKSPQDDGCCKTYPSPAVQGRKEMQDKVVISAERYSLFQSAAHFHLHVSGYINESGKHPGQTCHYLDRNTTGIPPRETSFYVTSSGVAQNQISTYSAEFHWRYCLVSRKRRPTTNSSPLRLFFWLHRCVLINCAAHQQ